jgi:hypothetical protein
MYHFGGLSIKTVAPWLNRILHGRVEACSPTAMTLQALQAITINIADQRLECRRQKRPEPFITDVADLVAGEGPSPARHWCSRWPSAAD